MFLYIAKEVSLLCTEVSSQYSLSIMLLSHKFTLKAGCPTFLFVHASRDIFCLMYGTHHFFNRLFLIAC